MENNTIPKLELKFDDDLLSGSFPEFTVDFYYKNDIVEYSSSYNFIKSDEMIMRWDAFISACLNKTTCEGYNNECNGGGFISTENGKIHFEVSRYGGEVSKYGGDFCGNSNFSLPNEVCIDAFYKVYEHLINITNKKLVIE